MGFFNKQNIAEFERLLHELDVDGLYIEQDPEQADDVLMVESLDHAILADKIEKAGFDLLCIGYGEAGTDGTATVAYIKMGAEQRKSFKVEESGLPLKRDVFYRLV